MEFQDDALAKAVFFLSTTETRSKLYRLLQYGSKFTKWTLLQLWELDAIPPTDPSSATLSEDNAKQVAEGAKRTPDWKKRAITSLGRAELVFGDARRLFRFLQFLEMADMYRQVREPLRVVRVLRRLRILCFFFFYLTENYVVFYTRVLDVSPREPLIRKMRRNGNGFWLLSILLAFPLDHMLCRGTMLSTVKKMLDLPVASVGVSGLRVSDGLFGALGLASAQIGVYSRWMDVMAKFQKLERLAATPDVA
ncbi:hypothetical protein PHYPSEUDO_014746 [Phytophthora pseudosyringae]|uniref:Uncharacterized protein n=1 Tax=Phytophthora pseudosyringae TaxID=221518 RepID=A0A8T1W012_9STRA|nr:hypothetical protein PHYPSEUDO_014746 [Phytophthora pseudosyringae]